MSRQLIEVQTLMTSLVAEHRKLLALVESHQTAIKAMDLAAMEAVRLEQEELRIRIAALENRRRAIVQQIAIAQRVPSLTLLKLAEMYPEHGARLLPLRTELRALLTQIAQKTHVAGRLAGAVLGHLNTAVRLLASAMHQAGVYTKQGIPRMSGRIGVIEAVG